MATRAPLFRRPLEEEEEDIFRFGTGQRSDPIERFIRGDDIPKPTPIQDPINAVAEGLAPQERERVGSDPLLQMVIGQLVNTPTSPEESMQQFIQRRVSPARAILSGMISGAQTALTGQKSKTIIDNLREEFVLKQDAQQKRQQLLQQRQLGVANILGALERQGLAVESQERRAVMSILARNAEALQKARTQEERDKANKQFQVEMARFRDGLLRDRQKEADEHRAELKKETQKAKPPSPTRFQQSQISGQLDSFGRPVFRAFDPTDPSRTQLIDALGNPADPDTFLSQQEHEDLNKTRDAAISLRNVARQARVMTPTQKAQVFGTAELVPANVREFFGADPFALTTKRQVNEAIASRVRAFTGAQATDREREFLAATLPSLFASPENFFRGMELTSMFLELQSMKKRLGIENIDTTPAIETFNEVMIETEGEPPYNSAVELLQDFAEARGDQELLQKLSRVPSRFR